MQQLFFLVFSVLMLNRPEVSGFYWQGTPEPAVKAALEAPVPGQALQGSVPVSGNTAVVGFQSAELEFSYAGHALPTWFLIWQSGEPVTGDLLARWDTMAITDGDYNLRLTVFLEDGSRQVANVEGLRVRNYTPVETDTPAPTLPAPSPQPAKTLLPSTTATATPAETLSPAVIPAGIKPAATLAPNPAQVSAQQVRSSLGKGALVTAGLFVLGGLYWIIFLRKDR